MESVLLPMEPVEPKMASFFTSFIFSDNRAYKYISTYLTVVEFKKKPRFLAGAFLFALLRSATSAAI